MTTGNTNAVYGTTDYPHGTVTVTVSDEESSGFEATVTASRADGLSPSVSKRLVLSAATQSVAFDLVPGTWTFSTTYSSDASGADTADQTVTAGGEYSVEIHIDYIEIPTRASVYGLIYDYSSSSFSTVEEQTACLTYTGACEGFTPMSGGNGDADEGSWAEGNGTIFDYITVDGITSSGKVLSLNCDKRTMDPTVSVAYSYVTRIPKIYQKVTDLGGSKAKLEISLEQFEGSTLHPAFVMDGVEYDYKDIGRYFATYFANADNDILLSNCWGNNSIPTGRTREVLRKAAAKYGDNYGLLSYFDWDLVNKLFLFAFKSFDAPNKLGLGYVDGSAIEKTGKTNNHSWMYGSSSDGTVHVSFLGLEDWWGNAYQILDNTIRDGSKVYVGQSSNPSDTDTTGMTCYTTATQNGIKTYIHTLFGGRNGLDDFCLVNKVDPWAGPAPVGKCDDDSDPGDYAQLVVGAMYSSGSSWAYPWSQAQICGATTSSYYAGVRTVHWGNNETSS